MKFKYKVSLILFFIEVLVLNTIKSYGIKIESIVGSVLVTIIFFLPLQYLFFSLSKDENCSTKKRKHFKIIFWFLNYCIMSAITGIVILQIM